MENYAPAGQQLVVEFYTRDIKSSTRFYQSFGFEVVRDNGNFVALRWEDSLLFLEEVADAPMPDDPAGNIRIMVANVDHYWDLAQRLGARVTRPIENRYYGLRDFTIAGPDGLGLRFATRLTDAH